MQTERLKNLRIENELSQNALASHLNIHQTTYSKYEKQPQKIPAGILDRIADYYGTSMDFLVGRTDETTPYPESHTNISYRHISQNLLVAEHEENLYKKLRKRTLSPP